MVRRSNFMFTNKKHSTQGMISSVLGVISIVSVILAIMLSYQERGQMNARLGLAVLFAFLFSIGGMVKGVQARMDKDTFPFFPILGLITNGLVILATLFIIYAGVYGL